MNGEDAALIITAVVGPTGIGGVIAVMRQWRKGKADPISTAEVRTQEVAKVVETASLENYYPRVLQDMVARITELEAGRDENRKRIMALERRDSVHLFYAWQLRSHIEQRLAPPPPPWPKEIDPSL